MLVSDDHEDRMTGDDILPYSRWNTAVGEMARRFTAAQPFPHIVIDDFLQPQAADRCLGEFPALNSEQWIHYTHVNERKYGRSDRQSFSPAIGATIDEVNSPRFIGFLEALTGIPGLMADPGLMGGGLHQSSTGGYLNIHADFTGHPHHETWQRRVNLLIYLNREWDDSFGGHLELWDRTMSRCVHRVAPVFNRAVIFKTDPDSFHGHPEPMTCPPSTTRKSMALYYFTQEAQPFKVRSTEYRARPGDGGRAALIYLDKMALRAYDKVKRTFGLNDQFASKLLKKLSRGLPSALSRDPPNKDG
jgi:hypothetical protein